MRKTASAKKEPKHKTYFFDLPKETKKEREARINAMVKKALKGKRQPPNA